MYKRDYSLSDEITGSRIPDLATLPTRSEQSERGHGPSINIIAHGLSAWGHEHVTGSAIVKLARQIATRCKAFAQTGTRVVIVLVADEDRVYDAFENSLAVLGLDLTVERYSREWLMSLTSDDAVVFTHVELSGAVQSKDYPRQSDCDVFVLQDIVDALVDKNVHTELLVNKRNPLELVSIIKSAIKLSEDTKRPTAINTISQLVRHASAIYVHDEAAVDVCRLSLNLQNVYCVGQLVATDIEDMQIDSFRLQPRENGLIISAGRPTRAKGVPFWCMEALNNDVSIADRMVYVTNWEDSSVINMVDVSEVADEDVMSCTIAHGHGPWYNLNNRIKCFDASALSSLETLTGPALVNSGFTAIDDSVMLPVLEQSSYMLATPNYYELNGYGTLVLEYVNIEAIEMGLPVRFAHASIASAAAVGAYQAVFDMQCMNAMTVEDQFEFIHEALDSRGLASVARSLADAVQ